MSVAEIKQKLLIVVSHRSRLDAIMHRLDEQGCVSFIPIAPTEISSTIKAVPFDTRELKAKQKRLGEVEKAIEYIAPYTVSAQQTDRRKRQPFHGSKGRATPRKEIWLSQLVDKLLCEITRISNFFSESNEEEARIRELIERLQPWTGSTEDARVRETENTYILYGTVPIERDVASALSDEPADILEISATAEKKYVRVIFHKSHADRVRNILESLGYIEEDMSFISGSPSAMLINAQKRLMQLEGDRIRNDIALSELAEGRAELEEYRDGLFHEIWLEGCKTGALYFSDYACIKCTFPEEEEDNIRLHLGRAECAFEIRDIPMEMVQASHRRSKRSKT